MVPVLATWPCRFVYYWSVQVLHSGWNYAIEYEHSGYLTAHRLIYRPLHVLFGHPQKLLPFNVVFLLSQHALIQ